MSPMSAGLLAQPVRRAAAVFLLVPLAMGAAPPAAVAPPRAASAPVSIPHPILFVTQVPIPEDFTTIGSVFGNHLSDVQSAGRGGDLHILYPGGALRNLTREAGFGNDGFQGGGAIAVREPSVHWSGTKALFSMVVGATTERYEYIDTWWQIYEVTGLGANDRAVITRVPRQPADANNVSPLYAPDGRILFTSDRPRGGERHLYPQLDEYEEAPTNTGLWSLDPATGDLRLLDHAPSGAFRPILDSFGRVVYTRWDHLERDQQADAEGNPYGTFDYANESAGAARLATGVEIFPEPRSARQDLLAGTPFEGHSFNHFFPWQINPDGTEHETLNHVGRHELHEYFNRDRHDDDEIAEFIAYGSSRFNPNPIENLLQIREDPRTPGRYLGVDAPEFRTHASGRIVSLDAPAGLAADRIKVTYLTHPSTVEVTDEGEAPAAGSTGHYRNPLPLSDGALVAVHAAETRADENTGSREQPASRYAFRLKRLEAAAGGYLTAGAPLTAGIRKTVSYWDPDERVTYSGELWELDPVEVRARPAPPARTAAFEPPERGIFEQEGVNPEAFRSWLSANGLAVMVSRNVTTRDEADRQQPFNLQVAGGGASTTGSAGRLYAVSHLQIFQADQVRGLGGVDEPRPGRRVLSRVLHDARARNPVAGGPAGSVRLAPDGSAAAFVPARRALTWQLTDTAGQGVLRERYWLTFQPGEIRVCTSCHGPNSRDQRGQAPAANPPEALRSLLRFWKAEPRRRLRAGTHDALPQPRPLQGGGRVEGLRGQRRRRPRPAADFRHGGLLVLRSRERRGRHQGPRRPEPERQVLGLLRRPVQRRVHSDDHRYRDRRGEDLPQPGRYLRQRRRHRCLARQSSRRPRLSRGARIGGPRLAAADPGARRGGQGRLRTQRHGALPQRRPFPRRDRLERLFRRDRKGQGLRLDERHRQFLVLRSRQPRGRRQGPRRPRPERPLVGLLRRPVERGIHHHRQRYGHQRPQDLPQSFGAFRERGGYDGVLTFPYRSATSPERFLFRRIPLRTT